ATPERRASATSRRHYPQSREPGPQWVLPGVARAPVPEGRLFVRWRQRSPHTGQSPARTLLLPDACPTSNPKTQELLGWHGPSTLAANSRRGQQACPYLVQYLLNKSREPGLQRIRTLTLPLGQDLPCEVVDVGYW